jgi:hypothetical protein
MLMQWLPSDFGIMPESLRRSGPDGWPSTATSLDANRWKLRLSLLPLSEFDWANPSSPDAMIYLI